MGRARWPSEWETPCQYVAPTSIRRSRDCLRGGVPSFAAAVRRCEVPSNSFSSLWAAFTLTVHINALYNGRVHGKEEHAT